MIILKGFSLRRISVFLLLLVAGMGCAKSPSEQKIIERVEKMPNMPSPYKMRDWKKQYDIRMQLAGVREINVMSNLAQILLSTFGAVFLIQHAVIFYTAPYLDMGRWLDVFSR